MVGLGSVIDIKVGSSLSPSLSPLPPSPPYFLAVTISSTLRLN